MLYQLFLVTVALAIHLFNFVAYSLIDNNVKIFNLSV